MALRLYGKKDTTTPEPDKYIDVSETPEGGLHFRLVNRDGSWIRHLFTLSTKGILRNFAVGGVGFDTDEDGRISVYPS